ncbi:mannosyl-oligosaccharide 1,2-alpha-mannosidase IB [Pyricularia oryzae 70-15]|uniref:alpha-1,2-Mannosidase n=3 Tax=Pyricularia oryzae TaxID=318829 RepID=G4NEJ3_PYRO7|nr:mannosyl-oligosaccharide 1,2-alpha-mannosidase IB [Pyricularia oryzae 70-15]EHA49470.1 mannosyl-oligosaccharide 1,2-alpha-mannosidase IB [Pyricularia oryzae 70-15]ELQ44573.1 mannosyl-oligosaccharide 1,2-alpha-mannosidase IB [Pyricularia oryzae Y34]KAI7923291.1 mannosyl-oligosaccharide 1 [Pyricularia oryzae]KAI7923911.1 mannosyl-oligosaccharide 1 [Pyricularia oryzae]
MARLLSYIFVLGGLFLGALSGSANGASAQELAYPKQKGSNYDYTGFESNQTARAQAVVEMFRYAWNAYHVHAFPHDSLRPLYGNYSDDRGGWGVTAVDGLDTAIIMEQTDIVNTILEHVRTINFTKTNTPKPSKISLFETNIRYLGGLLSAYDLLKGPFSHLQVKAESVDVLLRQAKSLADTLKFAFNTKSGIPVGQLFIENQTFSDDNKLDSGAQSAGLAELGTLVLEWQRLSDLTGDAQYGRLAQKAESYFLKPSSEVWPGLTGGQFNCDTGEILDRYGGWTSGNDSAYEYLVKMYVYDPERYAHYGERFTKAADSTVAHLLSHPSSRPDLTMVTTFAGTRQVNYTESLACFIGGSFILGSTALARPDWLQHGLDFSEYCANGYRQTASGIGPALYSWDLQDLKTNRAVANQTAFYAKAGFYLQDGYSIAGQAPEAVESWYYAYQWTGDRYWRDVAWAATLAQNRTMRVPGGRGFGYVRDVLREDGGGVLGAIMQSFMLAETLKYQYLIQAEKKGEWDVGATANPGRGDNKNFFVYNTEAHPLRVAAKTPV